VGGGQGLVPEHACLQFGIGSVPNAVAAMLQDHRDLGVHTELLSDGIMSLIEAGAVTNKYKRINRYKNVFNLAAGSWALYEALHDNLSMEYYPTEYVNDPYIIGMNEHVLSVNAMLEVDLSGQVNAEFLHHHQYTTPGGQLDFVRGAAISKGGVSIITGHATADHGQSSHIVPKLEGPITDPRMDTQFIVTEYGVCDLRGKSTTERALGLIAIAHPEFREELLAQAKELGYVS
jgi:itaconate CoA-transferase